MTAENGKYIFLGDLSKYQEFTSSSITRGFLKSLNIWTRGYKVNNHHTSQLNQLNRPTWTSFTAWNKVQSIHVYYETLNALRFYHLTETYNTKLTVESCNGLVTSVGFTTVCRTISLTYDRLLLSSANLWLTLLSPKTKCWKIYIIARLLSYANTFTSKGRSWITLF